MGILKHLFPNYDLMQIDIQYAQIQLLLVVLNPIYK